MKLKDLLKGIKPLKIEGDINIDVKDVAIDSNCVVNGSLFICIKGGDFDGHSFCKTAEQYGAVAIICQRKVETNLTQIMVEDTRIAMSVIASNFYNNPEKEVKIIGVTGTNGKTTTVQLISKILNDNGINCGTIGTLGIEYNQTHLPSNLTTPDPLVLFKTLRDMVNNGVRAVAMEVSAHATYFNKIYGLFFEACVFTNLTQDHLDFFEDMDNYKKAKISLFDDKNLKYAVLNSDDKVSLEIANNVTNKLYYVIENPSDVFAIDVETTSNETHFVINLFDCIHVCKIKLTGLFNVYNTMAAASVCALMGVDTKNIVKSLNKIEGISGRLESVYKGDYTVIVDYAHTPDGLEKCLLALKPIAKGKLICVFGCGGNRDSDKRSKMGEISGNIADFTVITSDNPRFEEPMEIIWQIEKGVLSKTKNYVIVQDREEAIRYAVQMAKKGDVILVAGKGSEQYQEVLGIKKPYNDKDTINDVIRGVL